jgi:anti-anti-sigma factor
MTTADDRGGADAVEVGVTVALHGELTFETADRWHHVTQQALDLRPAKVSVDLSDVTFLDSSGMYVLVRLRRRSDELDVPFEIVGTAPNVLRALQTAELTAYLGVTAATTRD